MAISFNRNSVFNLKPIPVDSIRNELYGLLINEEFIIAAFQTIRDQVIFTTKRIISIDVQGITGHRKSYTSIPYAKIQYFTVQTAGFLELIPDSELFIMFSNGYTARFEFKSQVDIGGLARIISTYILQ